MAKNIITTEIGVPFEAELFREAIESDSVTYRVGPVRLEGILGMGDIEGVNEVMVDEIVDKGHLLQDVSYKLVAVEGEVLLEATVADCGPWLSEMDENLNT